MASVLASLPGPNLFSTPSTTPPPSATPRNSLPPKPPIPIPKYPPPSKSQKPHKHFPNAPPSTKTPAFKTHHHNSKYYKPIKPGQLLSPDGDRSVVVGDSGVSYRLPGAPFDFQFSYSETPKAKPVAIREPAFLPFAPPSMPRPWTGKAPLKKSNRKIKLFQPLGSPNGDDLGGVDGVKKFEMLRGYELGKFRVRPREEVLGKPLSKAEIKELVRLCVSSNRQVNLGRDGLTHNMLELIHTHWRKQPVCKVRCLGVPTVDMRNICQCLEEKTGGKVIHRVGGVVYLFRGRNYDHRTRPKYPVMLWKPATPVYPKLIQEAPEGLSKEEADELRTKGKKLLPICKLAKNGVYITLVRDVRTAFEGSPLVKIDCKGMHASDYKKLGAKLKELVPCVLLSFDEEQILMWRGKDWKSMHRDVQPVYNPAAGGDSDSIKNSGNDDAFQESHVKTPILSSKMMSKWQLAIECGKALLLNNIDLEPDELLSRVEEFETTSQATEHSYPASILSNKDLFESSRTHNGTEYGDYSENEDDDDYHDDDHDSFEGESPVPFGALPVDSIARQLSDGEERDF